MYYEFLQSECQRITILGATIRSDILNGEQLHFLIATFNGVDNRIYTLVDEDNNPVMDVYVEHTGRGTMYHLEDTTLDIIEIKDIIGD
jgi:hypothetical protein